MTKVRAPNSLPSSLYANKPTESTAAEPQARCEATRHERNVLSLVFLVGETYRLLARTESSRDHELQSFGISFSAVPAMLLGPTEARSQIREPVGLTVSPARATIMKVAARHEAESKIDVQYYWTWRRCRWPTQWACPRALLEVAALGEKA